MNPKYVIAGNHAEYIAWLRRNKLKESDYTYLFINQLHNIKDSSIYLVGDYEDNPLYNPDSPLFLMNTIIKVI